MDPEGRNLSGDLHLWVRMRAVGLGSRLGVARMASARHDPLLSSDWPTCNLPFQRAPSTRASDMATMPGPGPWVPTQGCGEELLRSRHSCGCAHCIPEQGSQAGAGPAGAAVSPGCAVSLQLLRQCLLPALLGKLPRGAVVKKKKSACKCRRCKRCRLDPWVGTIPWGRNGQPTPVVLPGKSHGRRSLAGYSPWGRRELDTTEQAPALLRCGNCWVLSLVLLLPSV